MYALNCSYGLFNLLSASVLSNQWNKSNLNYNNFNSIYTSTLAVTHYEQIYKYTYINFKIMSD